jgi:single-strand DNA-binding protein
VKTIIIAGNIGKDAETRTTQGGDTVTSFNVAVEDRSGKEKVTLWFTCSMWGKRGDIMRQYLTKGSKVAVSGDLSTREHEGKTYLHVRVDQVSLMGGGKRDDDRQEGNVGYSVVAGGGGNGQRLATSGEPAQRNPMDDEIPFAPQVL